ncbi:MAG: hypothetical protein A2W19_05410 [Spirochaetes bacterium RBG_16_49_21]|nr:MAG: hypothetical protein A2W19_05410 [Spirochaetes bacterium RBG_16_49_21]
MKNAKTLLIYPPLGSDDAFIKDVPLSLLYLAAHSVKSGFTVEILDLRLSPDWMKSLKEHLTADVMLAGISVMTGNPIKNAIEITKFIKSNSRSKVIWGGHHPTMEPESTIKFEGIDYIIRGFGSEALSTLLHELVKKRPSFEKVPALSYRRNNQIVHNKVLHKWEMIPFRDIPYQLIKHTYEQYNRFGSEERIMPIFTSLGCPYQCSFCMAPVIYEKMKKKWVTYDIDEVIQHMQYLIQQFGVTYISVYDDDSFIDSKRMMTLLRRIIDEKIHLIIDFRGARINELDKMNDADYEIMVKAGVRHFQVGLESGSQKVLDIMNKKINIEQIIRVNKRLSRFNLVPLYNLMTGVPGETVDDIIETKNLVLRLYNDNPNCIVGFPAKFKPLPGTQLYYESIKFGLKPIELLEEWIKIDTAETDMYFPWYTRKYDKYIKMFQVTSFFLDKKILREIQSTTVLNTFLRIAAAIYRPLAMFRLKYNITWFNVEYMMYIAFRKILGRR